MTSSVNNQASTTPSPPRTERPIRALPLYEIVRHDSVEPDKPREYSTPEGRFPSVTSILQGSRDQSGLQEWREAIGHKRADKISFIARTRGTYLHRAIETFCTDGTTPPFSFLVTPYWKSLTNVLPELDHTLLIEAPIWHPEGFAGSIDWCGYLRSTPTQVSLVDWKTADKPCNPKKLYEYSLQLAAYVAGLNHVYRPQGLNIQHARLTVALPCRPAQIEDYDKPALDQLFLHFLARLQRFTFSRP